MYVNCEYVRYMLYVVDEDDDDGGKETHVTTFNRFLPTSDDFDVLC
jgi:hypothetical protein